ncbi:hypothetical protein POSPLADRAFT_1052698 [Postia placenta MAD-698-R-SB12]|uniref:Uncharacterized protein n=1 Tax=Postia placenta MAD-698-R-SB12 TaxID=670580 RepID=A0A1X6NBL0_9APHY|nr:hypothetical protein POSPLADRAFT_1052698 [Postia placenta MAD-698-R-SB12]OSX66027.1 hypothetical protein POSPLADRAFT_1052698 [Postia placenta MAD-698-R-SB12]
MALFVGSLNFRPATRVKAATCSYISLPDVDDVFVTEDACCMDWRTKNAVGTDSLTSAPHSDEEHIPDLSSLNLESPRGGPHLTPKSTSLELKSELTFGNRALIQEYSGETGTQPVAQAQSVASRNARLGALPDEDDQKWSALLEPIDMWLAPLKMWF